MKRYIYENYRDLYPELEGHELTDALILRAVGESGLNIEGAHVIRDHRGKPFVAPASRLHVHVSVSHCMSTFACLISDENCGIDIQDVRKTDVLKIARRYFTQEELELVEQQGAEMFYKLWTRKEAYAKFTGNGIGEVIRGSGVLDREDVVFEDLVLDNGMYCAICRPRGEA